jgi:hypothetical protein
MRRADAQYDKGHVDKRTKLVIKEDMTVTSVEIVDT